MILDELKLHGLIKEKIENLSYKLHLKSNGDYNSELIMLHLANSELLEFTEVLNKKRSITNNKSNYPIKVATYLYDTSKLSELMLRVENPKCKDILSIVVLHIHKNNRHFYYTLYEHFNRLFSLRNTIGRGSWF